MCPRLGFAVLSLWLVVGCAETPYELLEVGAPLESSIEAGRALRLPCLGVPTGHAVEVRLEGEHVGVAGRALRVAHVFYGLAEEEGGLRVDVTEADLAALGGRGSFRGRMTVRVEGASAAIAGARDGVELELLGPPMLVGTSFEEAFDVTLGVDPEPEDADSIEARPALVSPRIVARGPSAPSELQLGDALAELDGLRLGSPGEARLSEDASRATVRIERSGREHVFQLERRGASSAGLRYEQLAAVLIAAAGLFGVRGSGRVRIALTRESRPGSRAVLAVLALGFALIVSTLEGSHLAMLLVALLTRLGAGGVALWREKNVTWATVGQLAASACGLVLGSLCFLVDSGVLDGRSGVVATRSHPLEWGLVRAPFGPLALVTLVLAVWSAPLAIARPADLMGRLLRGVDDVAVALAVASLVRVALLDPSVPVLEVRALALVLTVLLTVTAFALRGLPAPAPTQRLWLVGSLALLVVVVAAWSRVDATPQLERAVAEVALVVLGLAVLRVGAWLASAEGPSRVSLSAAASRRRTPSA